MEILDLSSEIQSSENITSKELGYYFRDDSALFSHALYHWYSIITPLIFNQLNEVAKKVGYIIVMDYKETADMLRIYKNSGEIFFTLSGNFYRLGIYDAEISINKSWDEYLTLESFTSKEKTEIEKIIASNLCMCSICSNLRKI